MLPRIPSSHLPQAFHDHGIQALAVSSDGFRVATYDSSSILIWPSEALDKPLEKLNTRAQRHVELRFGAPANTLLVLGENDAAVRDTRFGSYWDLQARKTDVAVVADGAGALAVRITSSGNAELLDVTPQGFTKRSQVKIAKKAAAAALSRSGARLAIATSDGAVHVYTTITGELVATLVAPAAKRAVVRRFLHLTFPTEDSLVGVRECAATARSTSPSDDEEAVPEVREREVTCWSIEPGADGNAATLRRELEFGFVFSVAPSPDGTRVAVAAMAGLALLDPGTLEPEWISRDRISCAAWVAADQLLVGGREPWLRRFARNSSGWAEVAPRVHDRLRYEAHALSPDGRFFALALVDEPDDRAPAPRRLELLDTQTLTRVHKSYALDDAYRAPVAAKLQWIGPQRLQWYDELWTVMDTGLVRDGDVNWPDAAGYSADGTRFLRSGKLAICDAQSGEDLASWDGTKLGTTSVYLPHFHAQLSAAGDRLIAWGSHAMAILDVGTRAPIFEGETDDARYPIIAPSCVACVLIPQEPSRLSQSARYVRPPAPRGRVWPCTGSDRNRGALASDGRLLVVHTGERRAQARDAATGETLAILEDMWTPLYLAFHPIKPEVFAVSWQGEVQRWDLASVAPASAP